MSNQGADIVIDGDALQSVLKLFGGLTLQISNRYGWRNNTIGSLVYLALVIWYYYLFSFRPGAVAMLLLGPFYVGDAARASWPFFGYCLYLAYLETIVDRVFRWRYMNNSACKALLGLGWLLFHWYAFLLGVRIFLIYLLCRAVFCTISEYIRDFEFQEYLQPFTQESKSDPAGYPSEKWIQGFGEICLEESNFVINRLKRKADPVTGEECMVWHMDTISQRSGKEVMDERTLVVSYVQQPGYEAKKRKDGLRTMKAPVSVDADVRHLMQQEGFPKVWHDGGVHMTGDGLWNKAGGIMPYVTDGCTVGIFAASSDDGYEGDIFGSQYREAEESYLKYASLGKCWRIFCCYCAKTRAPMQWSLNRRFWMLAEACAGCVHGRVDLMPLSKIRASLLMATINYAVSHVTCLEWWEERVIRWNNRMFGVMSRGPIRRSQYESLTNGRKLQSIRAAKRQLKFLRREYARWLCLVTAPDAKRTGQALSEAFLEPMFDADIYEPSDRIPVTAMVSYIVEKVKGSGAGVMEAVQEYRELDDQLLSAWREMCLGSAIFPFGMTMAQRYRLVVEYIERTVDKKEDHFSLIPLVNFWPNPVPGRCFMGSMTTSPWKTQYIDALESDTGLCAEADTANKINQESMEARQAGMARLSADIAETQAFYVPLVGDSLPWFYLKKMNIVFLPVLDLRETPGKLLAKERWSGTEQRLWHAEVIKDVKDENSVEILGNKAASPMPFNIDTTPLLQMAMKISPGDDPNSLVSMRRVRWLEDKLTLPVLPEDIAILECGEGEVPLRLQGVELADFGSWYQMWHGETDCSRNTSGDLAKRDIEMGTTEGFVQEAVEPILAKWLHGWDAPSSR